ncbi:MSHA biogenesis protein MshI [Shewanella sp. Isolate11]|uniref:MSHA biogenesis protein MshI n=1 Tax=Shewanella sp. Isolate11 TaxID=2908530 RepID=UPI001EFC4A2B|nr:MSHA biogenesis protein MshI [Shewanella sp. Isolate11]MCG9695473.1 MSHA biogenesis protein MshI [Shewanella sp. Isolate11]
MEKLLSKFAFWQKKHERVDLGVHVTPDALTVYQADAALRPIPLTDHNWHEAFETLAKRTPGAHLQLVLNAAYYQLLIVDKPVVEESEISQALPWSIKDMLAKPLSEVHFDYFESPQSNSNKLTVVVVERQLLSNMAVAAQNCGIVIEGITIPEMAISHVLGDASQAQLVLCHEPNQELKLAVIKQGQLFMQRSVRGFNQLHSISAQDLSLGVADNLSLELQRSMDYFESQLRQAPITSIKVLMEGASEELAQLLSNNFDQQVTSIACTRVADKLAELAYAEFSYSQQEVA